MSYNSSINKRQQLIFSADTSETTGTGNSGAGNFQLPFTVDGTYNCMVDWGDGNRDKITVWDQPETLHTYISPGIYVIKIWGKYTEFKFNDIGDMRKVLSIEQFGNNVWEEFNFNGCRSMVGNFIDNPTLVGVTGLTDTFRLCLVFNTDVSGWDISNITSLEGTFDRCFVFNQDISSWDISNVTTLESTFEYCRAFNTDLTAWGDKMSNLITLKSTFAFCDEFNQPVNAWDISNVHTLNNTFHNCPKFNQPLDNWNTSNVTGMTQLFDSSFQNTDTRYDAYPVHQSTFNQDITGWDVSNVITFDAIFRGATAFTQDVGSNNWDISSAVNIDDMFYGAWSWNHPVAGWNTSNVTTMKNTFRDTPIFNQPMPTVGTQWDTSNVTNMTGMFMEAMVFHQDLLTWDVSNVTSFSSMFNGSTYTLPLHTWDTGSATNLANMFKDTLYNQPVAWMNTANVKYMNGMFENNTAFNQSVDNWSLVSMQNYERMFKNATSYNQPMPNFAIGHKTLGAGRFQGSYMFDGATSFNQVLSSMVIRGLLWDADFMFRNTAITPATYAQQLDAWATYINQGTWSGTHEMGVQGLQYPASHASVRQQIIDFWSNTGQSFEFVGDSQL